jgi:predicted dehydrogenase
VHAEQAIAALERGGLAVFCQKPLGRDADEVRRIVDTARRANRLLEVDLSYRHVEGVQKIRELVRAGQLGKIFAADLVFHNAYGPDKAWFYDPKLSGGGCVMDLGIHLVDLALWILDTSVVEVTAQVFANGEPLPIDSKFPEDYAVARLTLDCGAVANIACSWRLHAGRDAMIEATFFGTRGGVAMRNVNGSFFDFITERFRGTKSEIIAQPPEAWGGRAAVGWVKSLARSNAFNPEIERQIEIAQTLDAIYGAELVAARRSKSLFSIPR